MQFKEVHSKQSKTIRRCRIIIFFQTLCPQDITYVKTHPRVLAWTDRYFSQIKKKSTSCHAFNTEDSVKMLSMCTSQVMRELVNFTYTLRFRVAKTNVERQTKVCLSF